MGTSDVLRALGIPASWHFYLVSGAAMLRLAGLDLLGALLAKEWTERHHAAWFLAGLATFGLLFALYAASLRVAELSIVTLGWIVLLQVGLLLLDRFRYGVDLPPAKWAAVVLILLLQVYLVLGPNEKSEGRGQRADVRTASMIQPRSDPPSHAFGIARDL